MWGLPLGTRVSDIRRSKSTRAPEQLTDLERIDFSLNVSQTEWDRRVMPSFKVFANQYGHCRIPVTFVVPSHAPWPTKAWGMKLGVVVDSVRSRKVYAKQVAEEADLLESLGFQHSMSEYMWNERILPSLAVFKQVFGHCDVEQKFVVPSEAPWPEEAWGDKLGNIVNNIRSRGDFSDQIAKDANRLDAIGFVWDSSDKRWKNAVLPTLEMYFKQYGDTQIPLKFVVPSQEPWLNEAWGFKLGHVMQGIKYRALLPSNGNKTTRVYKPSDWTCHCGKASPTRIVKILPKYNLFLLK